MSKYEGCDLYVNGFNNYYIGITLDDIERIKNGEILHISGEYGVFIGLVEKKGERDESADY